VLVDHGRRAQVVNRTGDLIPVEDLPGAERDLVYLSLCLALNTAASRQGIQLPLVLDDPFVRLDARRTASLAAVLDVFAGQGHQVLVFTGQQTAAERLSSLGAPVREIASLRQREREQSAAEVTATNEPPEIKPPGRAAARTRSQRANPAKRSKKSRSRQALNGRTADSDQSDAA
jgi:hypothetical protein